MGSWDEVAGDKMEIWNCGIKWKELKDLKQILTFYIKLSLEL